MLNALSTTAPTIIAKVAGVSFRTVKKYLPRLTPAIEAEIARRIVVDTDLEPREITVALATFRRRVCSFRTLGGV